MNLYGYTSYCSFPLSYKPKNTYLWRKDFWYHCRIVSKPNILLGEMQDILYFIWILQCIFQLCEITQENYKITINIGIYRFEYWDLYKSRVAFKNMMLSNLWFLVMSVSSTWLVTKSNQMSGTDIYNITHLLKCNYNKWTR